jgi:hypothetical protein
VRIIFIVTNPSPCWRATGWGMRRAMFLLNPKMGSRPGRVQGVSHARYAL